MNELLIAFMIVTTVACALLYICSLKMDKVGDLELENELLRDQIKMLNKQSDISKIRTYSRKEFAQKQTAIQSAQSDIAHRLQSYLASDAWHD